MIIKKRKISFVILILYFAFTLFSCGFYTLTAAESLSGSWLSEKSRIYQSNSTCDWWGFSCQSFIYSQNTYTYYDLKPEPSSVSILKLFSSDRTFKGDYRIRFATGDSFSYVTDNSKSCSVISNCFTLEQGTFEATVSLSNASGYIDFKPSGYSKLPYSTKRLNFQLQDLNNEHYQTLNLFISSDNFWGDPGNFVVYRNVSRYNLY